MNRGLSVVFAALAFVLAGVVLATDPMQSVRWTAVRRLSQASAILLIQTLASVGGGAAVLQFIRRRPATVNWLAAWMTGWLAWGTVTLPLAWLGALNPFTAIAPSLLLAAGWLTRPSIRLPTPHLVTWSMVVVVAVIGIVDALAPPIDTDELYQHLALPGRFLREGHLLGGVLHPDGSRPQLLSLLYAPLLAWGTDTAPRLFSTACAAGILVGLDDLLRRVVPERSSVAMTLAGSILVGSYSFLHEVGLAANNLPVALAVLATTAAALAAQPVAMAFCAGVALSFKYTAAGALIGVWLIAQLPWKNRITTGLLALGCVAPWWLRNSLDGLHPLFPYLGWDALPTGPPPGDLTFQYLEKYGAGRSFRDFLLLPFRAVLTAEVGSFRFLGRLTPLVLLLVPPTLFAAARAPVIRRLAVVSGVAAMAWAAGPHWLRHLLPGLPIIAATLGAGTVQGLRIPSTRVLAAASVVWLAGAAANLGPISTHLADRLPVALGQEPRADYLARTVRSAPAVDWVNENLPVDARVAILLEWPAHLIERSTVLGSVEDHVPTRYWMLVHGERSLEALREQGVTHLVVGRFKFLRKWYPFLPDPVFDAMFQQPVQQLEELLLLEGTLVFEQNHTRVYRLASDKP